MQRAGVVNRQLLDYQKERGYANDTQLHVGKDRHPAHALQSSAYGNHLPALVRWGHQLALVGAQCEEERDDDWAVLCKSVGG